MRIIRILAVMALFILPIIPRVAHASGDTTSNETQIKFALNNNLTIDNGVIKNDSAAPAPYNYAGYQPLATPRDLAVAELAAKYGDGANLPQGKFTINVSAYTASSDECGKGDGITASGLRVKEGETIACPSPYPFGTKISIDGLGTHVCEDRGSAIFGNRFDIFMEKKSDAFSFGRQNLEAEVVM